MRSSFFDRTSFFETCICAVLFSGNSFLLKVRFLFSKSDLGGARFFKLLCVRCSSLETCICWVIISFYLLGVCFSKPLLAGARVWNTCLVEIVFLKLVFVGVSFL